MSSSSHVRLVTATSLFDGHDAAINIMRRILQASGAEVIHLGHDRSAAEIAEAAIEEDAHAVAVTSYQGGHMEFFRYLRQLLDSAGGHDVLLFGGGGGTILPERDLAAAVLKQAKEGDPWCRHIRRELVAFTDGELDADAARPIDEHLSECDECREEADLLVATGDADEGHGARDQGNLALLGIERTPRLSRRDLPAHVDDADVRSGSASLRTSSDLSCRRGPQNDGGLR